MSNIECPFDNCIFNCDNECQKIEVALKIINIHDLELLDCSEYTTKID